MGGGEVPHGFPQPNPTVSYWQLPPHRIANLRTTASLPTSTRFDYIVIGSGVSGAAIAYKLLSRDPSLSILMLEARTAASGASGRNGGHCRACWWMHFKKNDAVFGEDEAIKLENLEEQNVLDIANFVRDHNVECDFQNVETADAYYTDEAWAEVLDALRFREEVGQRRHEMRARMERTVWHGDKAREHLGLPNILGAVTYPAHTQNPYRLVCKMLELSLDKGLNLQTNTPALAVKPAPTNKGRDTIWNVETERGTVRATKVVLATNAYTNVLLRGLADTGFLRPSRSQVSALRPTNDISEHHAQHKSIGVNDRGSGDYFFIRAPGLQGEGDILYGGGRSISKTREMGITDDSVVNEEIAAYLKHSAPEVFGREAWGEQSIEVRDWSGITCYTPDTFPLVGKVPGDPGLWASVGMNGHGMALAFRSAEALISPSKKGDEPQQTTKQAVTHDFVEAPQAIPTPKNANLAGSYTANVVALPLDAFKFPELAPISREQVDFAVQQFQACITQLVQGTKLPFLHHAAYRDSLPHEYQDLLGVSAMYCQKTRVAQSLVFPMLDKSILRLISSSSSWTFEELLIGTQALVFYQIIRLFDGDIRQHANAETQLAVLDAWTIRLQEASKVYQCGTVLRKSAYDHWVVMESARRTVLVSVLLQAIYSLLRDGLCTSVPMMSTLPVSLNGRLWIMSEEEWWNATCGAESELVNYREYISKWNQGDPLQIDEYETLLLVACKHNAQRLSLDAS